MELGGRLAAIAAKIPECRMLADIGSDHAYIPIYAVKNCICKNAIATDVRRGPVEIARSNIRNFGCEKSITTSVGYGLEAIGAAECDIVVVAGMGGNLISEILTRSFHRAQNTPLLILQPMSAADVLRKWLYENCFEIADEDLAEDGGKIYNIMCARWTGIKRERDEFACLIGYELVEKLNGTPIFKKYLLKKMNRLDRIIEGKKASDKRKDGIEYFCGMREKIALLVTGGSNDGVMQ